MKLEEFSLKVFGKEPQWTFQPESKILHQKMENLRWSISNNIEKNSHSVKSELKRVLDPIDNLSKRVKLDIPEQPPTRSAQVEEVESKEPVFDDPMHVDAVFTAENPLTPPDLGDYLEGQDLDALADVVQTAEPVILDPMMLMEVADPFEQIINDQAEIMLSTDVPVISNEEATKLLVVEPPKSTPRVATFGRILNMDFNRMQPKLFSDKFLIQVAQDTPPNENEYEAVIIAPRVKEVERERKKTKFFNPDDFEDEDNLDADGNPKPKKPKGKGKTLEAQFGVEKGRVILKEVLTKAALDLLKQKVETIRLCDDTAVRNLKTPKLISRHLTVGVEDYVYTHIAHSEPGIILANFFKLSMKNLILRKRGIVQTVQRNINTSSIVDEKAKYLAQLCTPQVMFTWMGNLCQELRSKLTLACSKFFYYKELEEVEGIPAEKLPRNSLELALDYNELKVVHEKGLNPDSMFLIEFSDPYDMKKKIPSSRVFRFKFQQMIQMCWFYLLLNPRKIIETIASMTLQTEDENIEAIIKGLPKFNVEQTMNELFSKKSGRILKNFFETYITFTTNAEALFKISCHIAMFQDYHITAEIPRVPVLSGMTGIKVK